MNWSKRNLKWVYFLRAEFPRKVLIWVACGRTTGVRLGNAPCWGVSVINIKWRFINRNWRFINRKWRFINRKWRFINRKWRSINRKWRFINRKWRFINRKWRSTPGGHLFFKTFSLRYRGVLSGVRRWKSRVSSWAATPAWDYFKMQIPSTFEFKTHSFSHTRFIIFDTKSNPRHTLIERGWVGLTDCLHIYIWNAIIDWLIYIQLSGSGGEWRCDDKAGCDQVALLA